MKIDTVVVACHFWDLPLARAAVASIRYWHPTVDIFLLKDESKRAFSTAELERHFKAKPLPVSGKYRGWGMAKLEVLFAPLHRYLLVDADTIFAGPVLDALAPYDDDFIVTGIWTGPGDDQMPDWLMKRDYIDIEGMQQLDPTYQAPTYGINSGQMVLTNGKITAAMLDSLLDLKNGKAKPEYAAVFRYADQGIFNYLIPKLAQQGAASVRYEPFWLWPELPKTNEITVERLQSRDGLPIILHWAGLKHFNRTKLVRYDLVRFFEDRYYAQVPNSAPVRAVRDLRDYALAQARGLKTFARRLLK